jgi:hypothetical protein
MLASTCDVPAKAVFTCDQEIEREQVLTRPRPNGGGGALLPLSEARIASVEVDYDKLTGGHFQRQSASRRRGDVVRDAEEFPVAWACGHLRRRLAQGMPTLSNDAADAAALLCAANLRRLVAVWGHHPRFTVLGQTFRGAKSFHHNAALFAVADYLFQQGNRIGLAIPIGNGARTPDLYTRIGRAGKLHVEVKAPQALHWPGATASDVQTITAIVKKQLHGSRGQLSRRQRGVLVISTGITDPGFGDRLQAGIAQALASKGYNYRGVAAIVGMAPLATFPFELSGLGCRMIPVRNPAYDGVNPVGL